MYERVSNRNDAFREAQKASSKVKENKDGTSSLIISDFGENNLFEKIGFHENDEIESINGKRIDFANISTREALKHYKDLKTEFEQGKPLSVDILRNGKPTTLWFGSDWIKKE